MRSGGRGGQHRFDVAIVVGAAADVAGHGGANVVGRGMRISVEQRFGAHQLPGRAVSALRPSCSMKRFLQRMQIIALAERPSTVWTVLPSAQTARLAARVNRLAIQQHGACAAFAAIAADLGAGESQVIAQQLHQRPAVFHFGAMFRSVDQQRNGRARAAGELVPESAILELAQAARW
jgi:hypothetical protein